MPSPVCGDLCRTRDFQEMSWRQLNFSRQLCIPAAVAPRQLSELGIHREPVPLAGPGSRFIRSLSWLS